MALTRIFIEVETASGPKKQIQATGSQPVFFNPNQYALTKTVNWKASESKRLDLPKLQFDNGGLRTLGLSLLFDSYELGDDVRKLTKDVATLTEVAPKLDRPPVCTIHWGGDQSFAPGVGLPFVGVVTTLTQRFTLFLEDGRPARAVVELTLREIEKPTQQLKQTQRSKGSPIQAHWRRVKEGDSLWAIAADEYRDPAKWRPIAVANRLANPRKLVPGTLLLVPPLD
jgi:hypothetical protein